MGQIIVNVILYGFLFLGVAGFVIAICSPWVVNQSFAGEGE